MNKNPLHFFNSATNSNVLTLDIMDAIGKDMFGEGITAQDVSDAIKQAGSFDSIVVNINSPGGSLYDGVAAYNTLRQTGKPITTNVVGLAASAASMVAMAGHSVVMQPGSMMMVHQAMSIVMGYASDMRKEADVLDTVTSSAADIYVLNTKQCKTKILELMTAETWMTPKEAVALGFASEIGKSQPTNAATDFSMLKMFKNVPEELKKKEGEPFVPVPESEPKGTPLVTPTEPEHDPVINPVIVNEDDPLINILRKKLQLMRA
jgi:ATP-dependent Clp protease protease subunit